MFNYLERNKVMLVYWPLIIYWILLFTLTSLPSQAIPSVGVSDKIEHFGAFFILSSLFYLTMLFQKKSETLKKYALPITFFIITFYGALDELHQLLIPGRSCELNDLLADTVGALIAIIILRVILFGNKFRNQTNT